MINKILLISGLILLCSSCGGGGGGSGGSGGSGDPGGSSGADLDALVESIVDTNIVPSALRFSSAVDTLASDAESFCIAPTDAGLEGLQDQWLDVQEEWFRLSSYNFGPLNDDIVFPEFTFIDSLRLRGTNYLETVRGDVLTLIDDTTTLDTAFFSALTFQRTGLLAIEVLLFETAEADPSSEISDIVAGFVSASRKCDLLSGHVDILATRANEVSSTWQTSYRDQFVGDQLDDGSDPIAVLIISMQNYMDYLHARDVINLTAQVSQQAWASMSAAVTEMESYLEGEGTSTGFFDAMAENDSSSVAAVRTNLEDLVEAIADQNENALEVALQLLDGNMKREVPSALGVELGITFSDGD